MIWKTVSELNTALSPVEAILQDRVKDPESFLNIDLSRMHDPLLMKDMKKAVDRVVHAIQNKELIRIAGDYDSDGISSTYALMKLLKEVDAAVSYDIPNRTDGYGLSRKMIDQAYQDGCSLIITCDNGIAAFEAINYANTLNIDVIVTDHHEVQSQLPEAYAIVNPMQHDCSYPFKKLAGCAVAWKLCLAVLDELHPQGWLKGMDIIEIIAIGTVSDVMELVDENRIIVTLGLEALEKTSIIGLQELMKALNLKDRKLNADSIGFSIGPALNATGRLLSANEAVEMLLENSRLKALRSAEFLNDLNKERKELTDRFYKEILNQVKDSTDSVILSVSPMMPEGISGVVAGRVKEAINKPTIIFTYDTEGLTLKGSGRSVEGYNLFDKLMSHKRLLKACGGHEMACGLSIEPECLDELRETLNQEEGLTHGEPELLIDYELDAHLITLDFVEDLSTLEPFGKGNPKPVFQLSDVSLVKHRFMGANDQHIKLEVASDRFYFDAVGWNMADKLNDILEEDDDEPLWLDIVFTLGINEWAGRKNVQLELIDFRAAL